MIGLGFQDTISTGSVILGIVVLALAGFHTVRDRRAQFWRENYEAVLKTQEIDRQSLEASKDREKFLREEIAHYQYAATHRPQLTLTAEDIEVLRALARDAQR